jgi:cytochrome o ubiquinol oxidase operon protein cyoD
MSDNQGHGSMKTYVQGFVLSVALTLLAYGAVVGHWFSGSAVLAFILVLAVIQLIVQLVFFLHLGDEGKPRLNLTSFGFMLMVLIIVVFGSIWIMNNLNYHTMTPEEIIQDELPPPNTDHHDEHR